MGINTRHIFTRWIPATILGLIIVIGVAFYLTLSPVGPLTEVDPFMLSNKRVNVATGEYAFFMPVEGSSTTGLILYPGGRVDYRSYAPLAYALAEKGWPVAIAKMPINLAFFAPDSAGKIINNHPEIAEWVIGGHSLGGSMASQYAAQNPDVIAGVVFLASYPAGDELISSGLPVISIYASNDGLITPEEWQNYRPRFPVNTQWVEIVGGNHAGFGWYGPQQGDKPAEISLQEQTSQLINVLDEFLDTINTVNNEK
jgi:hypothetical protein